MTRSDQKNKELTATISDLHLSAGAKQSNGCLNPLEDFFRDQEFALLLRALKERADIEHVRFQLLGDIFDPQMVEDKGKFDVLPYESVCERQMRRIIEGHPIFFDALAEFLNDERVEVIILIGNHDFFLEWDGVKKCLLDRLGSNGQNLRFSYHEVHQGVWYTHGNIEPNNAILLTERYLLPGGKQRVHEPLLNYPYSSYLNAALTSRLRCVHSYIGRLKYHGYIIKEAATRNWRFMIQTLFLVLKNFFSHRFLAIWEVRRKARLGINLKILWWLVFGGDLETYAEKIIRVVPGIKAVVCGHDHKARAVKVKGGEFFNTGAWALLYDIYWDDPLGAPWGFRLLTRAFSYLSHLWHRPTFVKVELLPIVLARSGAGKESIGLYHFSSKEGKFIPWADASGTAPDTLETGMSSTLETGVDRRFYTA